MAFLEKRTKLHQAEMSFYPFPEENSHTILTMRKQGVSMNLQPKLLKFTSFKTLQRP